MKKEKTLLPIVCLMGPTASGKTAMAMDLAKHFPFDMISVDSAMVYTGMDIGTAKPDKATLKAYPHYLIDVCDPKDPFSAALFCDLVKVQIEKTFALGRLPLLVGGTMLYFKALLEGLSLLPKACPQLRAVLTEEMEQYGLAHMHARLAAMDKESAERIKPTDSQRIQRALEVCLLTGTTMSALLTKQRDKLPPYRYLNAILFPDDRTQLHENIAKRFEQMLAQGFVEEVEGLYQRGDLNPNLPSIRSVGYRQIWSYLAGEMDYTQMAEKAVIATRQLAKRQMTWLRSWPEPVYFSAENKNNLASCLKTIDNFLSGFRDSR